MENEVNGSSTSGSSSSYASGRSSSSSDIKSNSYYTYTPMEDLPDTRWYKILGPFTEVVKKAIPSELVNPLFFDAIYNTFGNAFRGIPDYPGYFDNGEFESIKGLLEKCAQAPYEYKSSDLKAERLNLIVAMKDKKIKMGYCPPRVRLSLYLKF